MNLLAKTQYRYFYQLIKNRLHFWLIIICASILFQGLGTRGNPNHSILSIFFNGIAFDAVTLNKIELPINWFSYFLIPNLILLDGIDELWQTRSMQLKGMRYNQIDFCKVSLLYSVVLSTIYIVVTFLLFIFILFVTNKQHLILIPNNTTSQTVFLLGFISFITIFSLLVLQLICTIFSISLGLIGPTVLLILTAYTRLPFIPINNTMMERIPITLTSQHIIISFLITLLLIFTYITLYKKYEFN